ncbi:hypothetical protein PSAC2689_50352 [Paraburkholderia sacchari]
MPGIATHGLSNWGWKRYIAGAARHLHFSCGEPFGARSLDKIANFSRMHRRRHWRQVCSPARVG